MTQESDSLCVAALTLSTQSAAADSTASHRCHVLRFGEFSWVPSFSTDKRLELDRRRLTPGQIRGRPRRALGSL